VFLKDRGKLLDCIPAVKEKKQSLKISIAFSDYELLCGHEKLKLPVYLHCNLES